MDKNCFYVGTARGTLLYTTEKPNEIKAAKVEEKSEVTSLSFGRTEDEIVLGYENGTVQFYDTLQRKYTKKLSDLAGEGKIVGIGCINDSVVVLGKHDGIITIYKDDDSDHFDINLDEKGSLNTLEHNRSRGNVVGTGGEFNDFKLWDVETHQCIFKAKSLGHDSLNLPIPTSVRGITFFPENEHLSGCATKEGHVLFYDDRVQRRPVIKFLETKASYTTIASAHRERQCLVGTTRGYMQLLDMKVGKCLKTFTNFTGSVTSIVCDPLEPLVACTSLDRHLRIYNLETKELLHKVYMKLNLTKLLMKPAIKNEPKEEKEGNEVLDEEYEDIFSNMETVISDKKIKKHKRKSENVKANKKSKKKLRGETE